MESTSPPPTPAEAAAAIADAEAGRTSLADQLVVPPFFFVWIGAAVGVQIGTSAVGLAHTGSPSGWLLGGGLVLFAAVAGYQLARFRSLNGVWLEGLASHVVGGTATAASLSYVAAFGGATWAAFDAIWSLVVVFAVAGGAAYGLSGRRWMRKYRSEPVAHGRRESAALLIVLLLLALGGLVLLVTQR